MHILRLEALPMRIEPQAHAGRSTELKPLEERNALLFRQLYDMAGASGLCLPTAQRCGQQRQRSDAQA